MRFKSAVAAIPHVVVVIVTLDLVGRPAEAEEQQSKGRAATEQSRVQCYKMIAKSL